MNTVLFALGCGVVGAVIALGAAYVGIMIYIWRNWVG